MIQPENVSKFHNLCPLKLKFLKYCIHVHTQYIKNKEMFKPNGNLMGYNEVMCMAEEFQQIFDDEDWND